MTKQEIIDFIWGISFQLIEDKAMITMHTINTIATELFERFEQEKKEQARDIFEKISDKKLPLQEFNIYARKTDIVFWDNIIDLAKEYGVEL